MGAERARDPWFPALHRWREKRRIERTLQRERALAETLCNYEGKWVAVIDSEVVASADTLYELRLDERPDAVVWQVPSGPCFFGAAA